jgi:hypothetical protein
MLVITVHIEIVWFRSKLLAIPADYEAQEQQPVKRKSNYLNNCDLGRWSPYPAESDTSI